MPLVDPAALPHLPIAFMNDDHAEEARRVNASIDAVEAWRAGRADAALVVAALDALYVQTRAHFGREEAAMESASFPALGVHRAEHERILGELGEAERRFREEGEEEPLRAFLAALPPWLDQHIRTMDTAAARYLAEWG
jgi:hemerythrin